MLRKRLVLFAGACLLAVMAAMLIVPARNESQTQDEAVYVVAGLSYWRTGDFRLNPEHPPLVKLLLGVPLILQGARFTPDPVDWSGASQWDLAPQVLYQNVSPGPDLLFSARLVNILLTLGLVAVCAYWSWRTFGKLGALITTGLLAFEPNILAMGHLATTDIGFSLATVGSVVTFMRWLERPTKKRLFLAAVVFTLAILTRFNALLLLIVLPTVYATVVIIRRNAWRLPFGTLMRAAGVYAAVAVFGVWLAYGFEFRPLNQPQDQPAREALAGIPGMTRWVERTPLPSASYLSGLLFQMVHTRNGQWAFLAGQTSPTGWWYYFPVALAVKLTLAMMVLAGLGIYRLVRAGPGGGSTPVFSAWAPLVVGTILLLSALPSRLDLGVRYVLPVIAILGVLAGGAALLLRKKPGAILVGILVGWHLVSVARHFPHWLPYANEAAGGPARLDRILIDSNLDWGQDIPLVSDYMRSRGIEEYSFQSFSTAPAEPYGAYEKNIPTDDQPDVIRNFRGVIAIGKSALWYPTLKYEWLRRLDPTDVLGHSINIYDLR